MWGGETPHREPALKKSKLVLVKKIFFLSSMGAMEKNMAASQNKTTLIDDALAGLEKELPAIFARHEAGKLLGGAIAPGTLANLGKDGPPYLFVGRNAVFEKASFLKWLRGRMQLPSDTKE